MNKNLFLVFFLLLFAFSSSAQLAYEPEFFINNNIREAKAKLFQRNYGMILGLQRGAYTFLELGTEIHWRKVSLFKPSIYSATTNIEYNLKHNVIGYKVGAWMKQGRVNLTYGINFSYHTNFTYKKVGVGPSVGFRILGFHLLAGGNFLVGDKELEQVNPLYVAARYYFPVDNKFSWKKKRDEKDKDKEKAKKKKRKAKEKKKKTKEKEKKKKQKEKGKRDKNNDREKKKFKLFGSGSD